VYRFSLLSKTAANAVNLESPSLTVGSVSQSSGLSYGISSTSIVKFSTTEDVPSVRFVDDVAENVAELS